jgi:biopolymer transport protein TolQ
MNHNDMSILSLVANASVLVQAVMAGLLAISIASWTVIFRKGFQVRAARAATDRFESDFWRGGDLTALYARTSEQPGDHGPLARIFESGMREFLKTRQQKPGDTHAMLEAARRAMRASYQREMDALESSLAFRGLANVKQATLAAVAPGIAEALVATAIGLFAAIPAFVAYNRFAYDVERLSNRFDTFVDEFSNILQRQAR